MSISQGGWGGWISDPSVIPPNSAYSQTSAGVVVNERSVLSLMAVSSCLRVLGDTGSGLEPHVYRMTGKRRSRADKEVDPPDVIGDPYADLDREDGDFRLIASLGLNGNLYKHVVDRDDRGNPLQVEILNPSTVNVGMEDGEKTYAIGATGRPLPAGDIVHVPWISLAGGLVGLNPIEIGAVGFGVPIAVNEYSARYFAQGMHPSGILSIEKPTKKEDLERIGQDLAVRHGGLAQSHTPIVLDAAARWQQISITPETAQLLQSKAFSRAEIAGFYGVPGLLIGENEGNGGPWGKGVQELTIAFALFGLAGYTRRLDRVDTALLPAGYYCRRRTSDLFKTNDQMLALYVSALRSFSVASPNEAREIAGMPRSEEPGADSLFAPINSAHADFLAASGVGPETGLPGGMPPKPAPGAPPNDGAPYGAAGAPEGGQG
jgi:HK97 family phage portal protein